MISTRAMYSYVPYSGIVWRGENLANRLRFAKLKPSKLLVTIDNPLADLFIPQAFSAKRLKRVYSPNFLPAKLSRYTVLCIYRIVGKFGGENVWRISFSKRLAEKSLANE